MKVVSYLKTVPERNSNPQKPQLLINFIKGVNAAGDNGIVSDSRVIQPADVSIIQGWVYSDIRSPHLQLRKQLIDTHTVVTGDANLFLYKNKINPHGYLRYSFNGIFPTTGIYCDTDINPARWNQISKDTNIQLEDYKIKGKSIILMLQRNKGWSLKGTDVQQWTIKTINQLRQHTDRPIIIRTHPGDKSATTYVNSLNNSIKNMANVRISSIGSNLTDDLHNAWAIVNHNSSAAVGPIIEGYHCFLTDPLDSQCAEVSNTDFKNIETPTQFDRQAWLERISMFHWKFSELSDGTCWRHMRNYCQ
jgi:hypothetical protein